MIGAAVGLASSGLIIIMWQKYSTVPCEASPAQCRRWWCCVSRVQHASSARALPIHAACVLNANLKLPFNTNPAQEFPEHEKSITFVGYVTRRCKVAASLFIKTARPSTDDGASFHAVRTQITGGIRDHRDNWQYRCPFLTTGVPSVFLTHSTVRLAARGLDRPRAPSPTRSPSPCEPVLLWTCPPCIFDSIRMRAHISSRA